MPGVFVAGRRPRLWRKPAGCDSMPGMPTVLPVLVVAVAGAAITAISVRRVVAARRWQDWQSLPATPARHIESGGEPSCWTGWPVLAAGLLLMTNVASDDGATPASGAWTDIVWLAIPLALAFVPPAAEPSPPERSP